MLLSNRNTDGMKKHWQQKYRMGSNKWPMLLLHCNTVGIICTLQTGIVIKSMCFCIHSYLFILVCSLTNPSLEESLAGDMLDNSVTQKDSSLTLKPTFQLAFSLLLNRGWQRFKFSTQFQ